MLETNPAGSLAQFRSLLRSFVLDPGLLFGHFLSAEPLVQVVAQEVGKTCDRIFNPPRDALYLPGSDPQR